MSHLAPNTVTVKCCPKETSTNSCHSWEGKSGHLMDDTHVVSQIKTGLTPSELSERQQRPGKTRGFNKVVGLTLSHTKTICCMKPRKNRQHSAPMRSFSLVPSASVTSLCRATVAFTEKAAGLRGRVLMECQGDLKGGSRRVVRNVPTCTHPHCDHFQLAS